MWYSITDACPNACWHVIIVKHAETKELIAYCRDCGAAWATPSNFTANDFTIASRTLPAKIEQPTRNELVASVWQAHIHAEVTETDYGTVADIETALEAERQRMA